ncbi:hypothetical protein [Dactylosporangium sp. NPDC049140]|uniref:hypothetical protein n=1 Tax=Dactylosporangium sp. NPDC049140 TaxID=3155647 RepID=UPI0033EDA67B
MISTDQLTALLQADFGAWSRDDVERVTSGLGWRLDPDEADGPMRVTARPRPEWDDRGWFGEYTSLTVHRGTPEAASATEHAGAHRAALADVAAVLGPPALVGGPDAWARWRLPKTVVTLEGSLSRRRGRSTLRLEVAPRDATENDESWNAKWNEDWEPWYSWRATAPSGTPASRTLDGMMSWQRRNAAGWDELGSNLGSLFASLACDLSVLREYAWDVTWVIEPADGRDAYVQGYFGRREADRVAVVQTREEWRRAPDSPGTEILNPTGPDGLRVAELALAEIRSWELSGPDGLCYQAWSDDGYRLDDFGAGLTWSGR